jgi:hypothetical protein
MRLLTIIAPLALSLCSLASTAHGAPSAACKQCQDQQRACNANYPGKTCKTEYDICMKACGRK